VTHMPYYPILTARLKLRPFTRGDVDAVLAYRKREDVARFLFDAPMNHDMVTEAIQQRIGQISLYDEDDKIILAVERIEDRLLIGEISLILRSLEFEQGEIGYIFNPDFHGQGYATEAAAALLAFGFDEYGMHRIMARCDARNIASSRVMERLGMRREAYFREHMLVKGRWDEEFIYAILASEWRARSK
jgi:RimJ/RimL family protein N-acetyltransferase